MDDGEDGYWCGRVGWAANETSLFFRIVTAANHPEKKKTAANLHAFFSKEETLLILAQYNGFFTNKNLEKIKITLKFRTPNHLF